MVTFAKVEDLTLCYKVEGLEAGVPLLFVNSLGTDLRIWDGVVPYLVDHFCIIRYDKRGHGLSDSPPGPYTLADECADIEGLLAHLDLEAPIVVGISVGGMIAADYAAQHEVRALVLADSALRFGSASYWQERSEAILERGMEAMAPLLAPRWFAPQFPARQPATYQGYVNMLARMPAGGYRATCDLLASTDLRDHAGNVTAPTLVLGGMQDLSSPPDVVRALAEALPQAQMSFIEGAGHLPCIEQPAAMARQMIAFFTAKGLMNGKLG